MRNITRVWEWRALRRAIRERWPIKRETVKAAVEAAAACLADPDASHREKMHAAKFLVDADKVNLEQEKRDMAIPDRMDITSDGKPISHVTVTAEDLTEARRIMGAAAGDVHQDGG